jgi:hypothetical protein
MHSQIPQRAGWLLLAAGIVAGGASIALAAVAAQALAVFGGIVVLTGIGLLRGGPRAALWVRTLMVFLLAAGGTALIAAPLFQPLDLTLTEIRLAPGGFAIAAVEAMLVLGLLLWVTMQLGQRPVQDEIAGASIRRWDMRLPAQAGSGIIVVAGLLLWLMLHGQSAELATSLASQQLGPGYQYHLSWMGYSFGAQGRSITGVVTAWNHAEVKTILLHWERL